MTSYRRPLLLAALAAWAGAVAYVTLTPAGHTPPLTLRTFLCVWCGEFHGSDMVRNWILFVPGGVLAALTLDARRALVLPVAFTCLIEFVQIGVPGRDPALQDLVLNSLGSVGGFLVATRGMGLWSRRVLGGTAAVAWLAPLVLLMPGTTEHDLYGQRTPRFGNSTHYEGRILESAVGEVALESSLTRQKDALDAAIVAREPVRLRFTVGQRPSSTSPVFQVVDGEQQGVLELLALRSDLILRGRNPARGLKLDQPDVRWDGAMEGLSRGDTVTLVIERGRGSVCMSLDERERCNLAPSLADGWGFVLNLEGPPAWFRALMSVGWALGVGGLVGLTTRNRRQALLFAAGVAAAGYVGALASPDVSPSLLDAAVLVAGALTGALLRGPVVSLWRELRAS